MDLNAPLGSNRPPKRSAWRFVPLAIGASLAAAMAIGLGIYLYQADPRGGEPYAVALVPPATSPKPAATETKAADPTPTGSIASPDQDGARVENGVKVFGSTTPLPPTAPQTGPFVIDVSKAIDANARRFAAHGDTLHPGASPSALAGGPKPRIAIVVGGLGLSETATRTAIETMPAAVSFAFLPDGPALTGSLDAGKARGHEILLQIPMQSAQETRTGPHTLRNGEPAAEVARDLAWLTSRFDGYVGVANFLGAPVTANQAIMSALLKTIGQKGLFYLDDGTSRRSVAAALGPSLGVTTVQTDIVLDATADPAVVQANLERLATLARAKGSAVGMASGLTDHLATIARFAAALDARGFVLVPVSAVARGGGSFATAR